MKSPKLLKKLTPNQVLEMKLLREAGMSKEKLIEKFNVSLTTINWHTGGVKPPMTVIGDYEIEL